MIRLIHLMSLFPGSEGNTIDCRENFYRDETVGVCVPNCYTWKPYRTVRPIFLVSELVGLVISFLTLIIMCVRGKSV